MTEASATTNAAADRTESDVPARAARKPYTTPTLSTLGNVRELTRAGAASNSNDALGANRRKIVPRVG